MTSNTLIDLPDEILTIIFQHLDYRSITAINAVSKRFTDISNEPLLWRELCQTQFRFWADRGAFRKQLADPEEHQWKSVFAHRTRNLNSCDSALVEIIDDPIGRCDRIQQIVDYGYEAKDSLLKAFRDAPSSSNRLAQRYWSWIAIGCLHRTVALETWSRIKYQRHVENPTERALAALDMFLLNERMDRDIDGIFDKLDGYAMLVREAYPDIDTYSPRQKAISVASCLRDHKLVGIQGNRAYHSLEHLFLGVALHSEHKSSLPLITAVIYCYVCRQFGLLAQPINFPIHVHCLVQPPPGLDLEGNELPENKVRETRLFMDPHNTIEPTPLIELEAQLRFLDTPAGDNSSLIPASAASLLVRSAMNVRGSINQPQSPPQYPVSASDAVYAAYFILVLFPIQSAEMRSRLAELTQHFLHAFDHDIHIFRNYIIPLTAPYADSRAYQNLLQELQEQQLARPVPKLRADSNKVHYRVGQVFRHRRTGYLAVIYGWDFACKMSNQWISMNQVDRLSRGRHQPFYNVLVADDGSNRYVAEENVILTGLQEDGGNGTPLTAQEIESFGIEVGKWFKRFDYEKGVFVSNVRHEYPED